MKGRGGVVCFGEVLLRLNAPGHERLLQSPRLELCFGGAEANVAAALAQFGAPADLVSVLPDNDLGAAARRHLRGLGIGLAHCRQGPGRMGLYFMATGAVMRPSNVLYDRADSAFAMTAPDSYDWPAILRDAAWLHISGITPALGKATAEAALAAVAAARRLGVKVSFDGNYRAQLWRRWSGDGPAILARLLADADLAFIDQRDIALILGRQFAGEADQVQAVARDAAFAAFPNLTIIAATRRRQRQVADQRLSASATCRDGGTVHAAPTEMSHVIDRIGGGDAFAAGFLYSLWAGGGLQQAIDFALAAAVLKHSIPGDMLLVRQGEVLDLMAGEGLDVRR